MSPHEPVVSVIIPAYNAASVIDAQLQALAGQDVDFDWELLICDNGSTDATAAVAERWSDRLPIRVIDASARRGAAAARNIGGAAARAPFLAFCDADDVVADGWLANIAEAGASHDYIVIGARGEAAHSTRNRPVFDIETTLAMPYLPQLPFGGAGHSAVRTDVFRAVGGFDESFAVAGEDVDFSWRVQLAGYPLTEWPAAVITITRRADIRSTVRQYYRYAQGSRQLEHKYARVIEAFAASEASPRTAPANGGAATRPTPEAGPAPAGRAQSRFARLVGHFRGVGESKEFLARTFNRARLRIPEKVGYAWGAHFAKIDASQPQLDPSIVQEYLSRDAV